MESPFFKLPRELWDQIYGEALVAALPKPTRRRHYKDDQAKHASPDHTPFVKVKVEHQDHLCMYYSSCANKKEYGLEYKKEFVSPGWTVLLINKQIHHEAAEALYGGVRFVVQSNTAVDLVTGIGPRNASLIRHLDFVINFRFGPPDMLDSVRKACTGLKNLRAVPDAYYYFDSFRRKAALRDLDRVHNAFAEATDIRRTLVMSGSRDYVTGWQDCMEESTRQAGIQAYFPILRRAKELGWNVRREEKVNGRFPDGEFISYYPDGEYFDHGLNEVFEIIEDPLDVEELILEAVRKR